MLNTATQTGVTTALVPSTGTALVDSVMGGSKWGAGGVGTGATVTFSFPTSTAVFDTAAGVPGNYNATEQMGVGVAAYLAGAVPFDSAAQAAARAVLNSWSQVANIQFTEVAADSTSAGVLRFALSSPTALGATTYGVSWWPMEIAAAGDTWLNSGFLFPEGWAAGTQNYLTLLHEVGHAIGLKHPHDGGLAGTLAGWPANGSILAFTGTDTLTAYSTQDMVMAYNDKPGVASPVQCDFAPTTPMRVDIAAMQYIYGANVAFNAGNTVYTFDSAARYNQTIWDGGGVDTIEAVGAGAATINLTPGTWSSLGQTLTYSERGANLAVTAPRPDLTDARTVYIYETVVIENAVGGSGADSITGNAIANRLTGGGGNDVIAGGGGVDTAIYSSARAGYTTTNIQTGWTVNGADGSDTLTTIERLQFSDRGLAIDTAVDGNAGMVAQIIRALLGSSFLQNPTYVGIGLGLFDQGMSYQQVVELAITTGVVAQLAGSSSNEAFVTLVYSNVIGVTPDAATVANYAGQISNGTFTQATLGVLASQIGFNTGSAELVGLASTGIEFAI